MDSLLVRRSASSVFFISLLTIILSLSGCSGSSTSSTASSNPSSTVSVAKVSFAKASVATQANIQQEAPHFNNTSVVTAINERSLFSHGWHHLSLFNEAVAAELGLSLIWDPESGSAPMGSDFALQNLYNGGGFTSVGSSNNCTSGSVTIPCSESLKNYMGQALDPAFQNSNSASITMFGRLQTFNMIICTIGNLVPASAIDTDGLPVAGTLTINFPADTTNLVYKSNSAGGCSLSAGLAGGSLTIVVSAVTSPVYNKLMTIAEVGIRAWLKLDPVAGTLDVLSIEDQRGNGRYAVARGMTHVTGINTPGSGTTKFEYISIGSNVTGSDSCYSNGRWQCSFEFHRVYIDETADVAYLVSNFGSPGANDGSVSAPTSYIQYTAMAKPSNLKACSTGGTCSGEIALSFTADGQQQIGSNTIFASAGNAYDGCVNLVDRSLAASATLSCSVTGVSILSGAQSMINTTRTLFVADAVASLLNNTNATTTFSFTDGTNIFTAADTN